MVMGKFGDKVDQIEDKTEPVQGSTPSLLSPD